MGATYQASPLGVVAKTIDGEECVVNPCDESSLCCTMEHFEELSDVMVEMGRRALAGKFNECQAVVPVKYPDGSIALLSAHFSLGSPVLITPAQ